MISRRQAVLSALFGTGCVGLRALATGLPASLLLNPRKLLADPNPTCPSGKAQFIILATSGSGDPINANVPGTYDDPKINHSLDPMMAPTMITMNGQGYKAAAPWALLGPSGPNVLDRTVFGTLRPTRLSIRKSPTF